MNNDRESLQEIRNRVKNDMVENRRLRSKAFDNFFKVLNGTIADDIVFISWEQLRTVKVGERIVVSEGSEFVKKYEDEKEMMFHTIIIEGGSFISHFHDCVEICTVLEGSMIETEKGDRDTVKFYSPGERAIYDKGEKHALHAKEYTLLEVRFLKQL